MKVCNMAPVPKTLAVPEGAADGEAGLMASANWSLLG
jgi:hypothetical protein